MVKEVILAGEFVSLTEGAHLLGISRQTLYMLLREGKLTRYRINGEPRLTRTEITAYLLAKGAAKHQTQQ